VNVQATAGPEGRKTLGLVLIALGLILTLDHAGVVNIGGLARWWPLFLIGVGTVKVRQPIADGQHSTGVALLFLGTFFLIGSILSMARGWPLIMIAGGCLLVWKAFEMPRRPASPTDSPLLSDMLFIGHLKRSVAVPDFRGGSVTAVMGGLEIDLRQSTIATSPANLDVAAVWGGIELKVPAGWTVESEVVPIMGGFENKTRSLAVDGAGPKLIVRGCAVMGAVVISD
jgi:hypothetical protein